MTDRINPDPDEPGTDVDRTASDPDQTATDSDQSEHLLATRGGTRMRPSALDLEHAFD
jgi:hypothetical protein